MKVKPLLRKKRDKGGAPCELKILEGVMSGSQEYEESRNLRVELKYCEHCGGLWIREGGGGVYCVRCQPLVADLPAPKKNSGRAKLPVAPHTVVDDYEIEIGDDDAQDYEAVGGVA